ncbi:unnamed protein product, partial [Closterium sp. Naga37s-1]
KLNGPIPSSIINLLSLDYLYIVNTNLTGPIQPAFGNLPNLTGLELAQNNLNGTIPDFISGMSQLQT